MSTSMLGKGLAFKDSMALEGLLPQVVALSRQFSQLTGTLLVFEVAACILNFLVSRSFPAMLDFIDHRTNHLCWKLRDGNEPAPSPQPLHSSRDPHIGLASPQGGASLCTAHSNEHRCKEHVCYAFVPACMDRHGRPWLPQTAKVNPPRLVGARESFDQILKKKSKRPVVTRNYRHQSKTRRSMR